MQLQQTELPNISENLEVTLHEFAGVKVFVFDNVFDEPEKLKKAAADNLDLFERPKTGYYPGITLDFSEFGGLIRTLFRQHCAKPYGVFRNVYVRSRYSIVTLKPEELGIQQRSPHRDPLNFSKDVYDTQFASVYYLFGNPALGGTSFYGLKKNELGQSFREWRSQGMPEEGYLPEFDNEFEGYMSSGNAVFEQIGSVDAKFNRMIVYPSSVFHAGQISHPELMIEDAVAGRLTISSFVAAKFI